MDEIPIHNQLKTAHGKLFRLSLLLLINVFLITSCSKNSIILENRYFWYEIDNFGNNLHFIDKNSGKDYLDTDKKSICATVVKNNIEYSVTSVSRKGNRLLLSFSDANVLAGIKISRQRESITLTVSEFEGEAESLTFLNVPLKLEGMPYEPFAACALSMNLFTRVRELPALQSNLWATCYSKFSITGAEVTIIGVPQKDILPVIRNVMSAAENVPFSDKGGAWAQLNEEGYGSYLMNFGTLTEATVDEWIKMCRNLGFNQIDNHGGGDFFRFGDFELNRDKWPDGWDSFKRINEKLHEAGISVIFHTYAFFIDKNTNYVTPIPSKDLGYFTKFTLARPVSPSDTEITVNESTQNISTITGFFVRNSRTLRIGEELIEFTDVTRSAPYKFTGCKRGANKTIISSHAERDNAFHLREMFGRFVPGPETELFHEIAAHTAAIVSDCGFDGIYFDAIDGSDILGGEEYFWYYGTKFIFEVVKALKKPVGMEMSSMAHHWWHYRSRWQAWDRPVRGYKRFIDIHSAAIKTGRLFYPPTIKSNENEHGLWRGHYPLISKYASAENGGLLLPLHFGWWGNQTWNPPQVEPTFMDDIEYLCCKMLGNNAGLSMLGGVDEKTLEANPLFRRITDKIKEYEELRHSNYFSDSIRSLLRETGKEFTLIRSKDGKWKLKPVSYLKHKVEGIDHPSSTWKTQNEFEKQPVKFRIEPLISVKRLNDKSGITLADFKKSNGFNFSGSAREIKASVEKTNERAPDGFVAAAFKANTSGIESIEGLWVKMEKKIDPPADLSKTQGLGLWVKGDGNGQLLNIRIESPKHLSHGARGDHFIKIDFTGWKYFELVEIESSEFSNYIWPDSGFYVYDSYRHTVLFNNIDKIQLWYNNLPGDRESGCLIGQIRALPLVPQVIENPEITVDGKTLTLNCIMEPGMYLEFFSNKNCKLYGPKGEFLKDVNIKGVVPELKPGENEIAFKCTGRINVNSRVQVTIITEGEPLLNK
ncbi:MAG TPA: carbohydrate binding domain-containing protein [Bacteroidales bacterium]|nr:carbohydrate binding domain-containing protein [Bacteroidales bacterium]